MILDETQAERDEQRRKAQKQRQREQERLALRCAQLEELARVHGHKLEEN